MLFFNLCEGWKKFWHHFGLFLSLFSTFHQNFLQLCKKLPSYISETHQLLFPLVNNSQKWCQKLCNIFSSLYLLQGECVPYYNKDLLPTSLKFLCCGESLFYLFDSKHENVVINYHYNCSSWNEKWWFVFHFSANVFSPEVILDKYLFRAHVFWNKAGSAHYQVNIYHGNF